MPTGKVPTNPAVLETLGLVGGGFRSPREYALLDSVAPRLYLTIALIQACTSIR